MAVVDATKETFHDLVGSGVVLVDVWADSCRPCVALAPHMESIASANPDVTVVKLDASKARRLVMSLQVRGLPTMLLFSDGQEVDRITDPNLNAEQVDAWLSRARESSKPRPTRRCECLTASRSS
jgi:thioredoxin 1